MTTPPLAPPLALAGHEFSRDRSPVDCPIRITSWRWRWHCSCGDTGTWQAVATWRIHRDWVEHVRREAEMEEVS